MQRAWNNFQTTQKKTKRGILCPWDLLKVQYTSCIKFSDSRASLGIGEQRLTFRFRNFLVSRLLPIFLGFRFRKIWSRKKSLGFGYGKFGLKKKSLGFSFGEFGLGKKFRLRKIWSKKKSRFGFGKLDLGKEKIKITRKKLDQVNSANLLFEP